MKTITGCTPCLVMVLVATTLTVGCSGGGSDGSDPGQSPVVAIDAGPEGQDIVLAAGQRTTVTKTFQFDIVDAGGPYERVTIDLSNPVTLTAISALTHFKELVPGSGQGDPVLFVTFRVGPPQLGDRLCTGGEPYGPFQVVVEDNIITQVTPTRIQASASTLNVINAGAISVCAIIEPIISTTISVDGAPATVAPCAEEPDNIAGKWSGTFTCEITEGICTGFGGNAELEILQDNINATYTDDAGASYEGAVCGNTFTFSGGVLPTGYRESGTFVLLSGSTAMKTSTYREIGDTSCAGKCQDVLTRQ